MSKRSRWIYYLASLRTLRDGVRNWPALPLLALRCPLVLHLRDGLRFRARRLMDLWIIKETCLDDCYACRDLIPPGGVIVDIGAGTGDFSIWSARHLRPAVVHAFEPHPASFRILQENLTRNEMTIVHAHPVALGGRTETLHMCWAPEPTQTTTQRTPAHHTVPGWSLAHAFTTCGIAHCQVLKLDCEGAEYDILLQADAHTLSAVDHIRMEYHDGVTPHRPTDLVRHLEAHGFHVRTQPSPVHDHLGYLFADRSAKGISPDTHINYG